MPMMIDPGLMATELAANAELANAELANALTEMAAAVGAMESGYWTADERAASVARRRAPLLVAAQRLEALPAADADAALMELGRAAAAAGFSVKDFAPKIPAEGPLAHIRISPPDSDNPITPCR